MSEQTFAEVQAKAARIIVEQAKGVLPPFPESATRTQVLVVQMLLDNAMALLPE